jgi:hypothetical protein
MVLDLIITSNDMKACNAVCASWHSYIQPRLLACVRWPGTPLEPEDTQVLQDISCHVRRLCVHGYRRRSVIPIVSLPSIIQTWNIVKLELRSVRFEAFADLRACISSFRATLSSVLLTDCEVNNVDSDLISLNVFEFFIGDDHDPVGLSELHLRKLSIDSIPRHNALSELILRWIALGSASTFGTLNKLGILLMCASNGYIDILSQFLRHPLCCVTILQITFSEQGFGWDLGRTYLRTRYRLSFELLF